MTVLCFLDTETTGLATDDEVWEFAAIRRELDGTESALHLFIDHDMSKCATLPDSFLQDHVNRFPDHANIVTRETAARKIAAFFGNDRPHIVGAVPDFDSRHLRRLLGKNGVDPTDLWHYHLIDVENLAVGYLAARGELTPPPWKSDEISKALGVDPDDFHRHSAMGDVLWCKAQYDVVMGGAS